MRQPPAHPPREVRGFTLVEMLMSCAILSILLLAIGSVLRLTIVSTGEGAQVAAAATESAEVADQIAADMNVAINFTERTATAVTFTVPDRTGDGQAEKLRYAWWKDGSTGLSPPIPPLALTREVNDTGAAILATDVKTFALSYLLQTVVPTGPTVDQSLAAFNPASGSVQPEMPDGNNVLAMSFKPSVTGASTWAITRVRLYCRADSEPDGAVRVQVRTANASFVPGASALEEVLVPELAMCDEYGWVDVTFKTLQGLSTSQNYAVVLIGQGSSGNVGQFQLVKGTTVPTTVYIARSGNGGSSWNARNDEALRFAVYGTTTP